MSRRWEQPTSPRDGTFNVILYLSYLSYLFHLVSGPCLFYTNGLTCVIMSLDLYNMSAVKSNDGGCTGWKRKDPPSKISPSVRRSRNQTYKENVPDDADDDDNDDATETKEASEIRPLALASKKLEDDIKSIQVFESKYGPHFVRLKKTPLIFQPLYHKVPTIVLKMIIQFTGDSIFTSEYMDFLSQCIQFDKIVQEQCNVISNEGTFMKRLNEFCEPDYFENTIAGLKPEILAEYYPNKSFDEMRHHLSNLLVHYQVEVVKCQSYLVQDQDILLNSSITSEFLQQCIQRKQMFTRLLTYPPYWEYLY